MLKTAYESLTLHNICDSVEGWRDMQKRINDDQLKRVAVGCHSCDTGTISAAIELARIREIYWLDKLERFFNVV